MKNTLEETNVFGVTFDNSILPYSLIEKLEELMEEDTLTIIGYVGKIKAFLGDIKYFRKEKL